MRKATTNRFSYFSMPTLVMLGAAIASLVSVFMLAVPWAMDAWEAEARITAAKLELEDTNLKLALLQDYQQTDLRNRLENTLLITLPKEFDVPLVLKALNQVTSEINMEIVEAASIDTSQDKEDEKAAAKLQVQHITMTVKGEVPAFKQLLTSIEQIAPILKIQSIKMNVVPNEEGIQAEVAVDTFAMAVDVIKVDTVDKSKIPVFDAQDEVLFEQLTKLRKLDPTLFEESPGDATRNPFEFE